MPNFIYFIERLILDIIRITYILGIVTTSRITHATPAALYANVHKRGWECDADEDDTPEGFHDIAWQLINQAPGNRTKVILGGGRENLMPNDEVIMEFLINHL